MRIFTAITSSEARNEMVRLLRRWRKERDEEKGSDVISRTMRVMKTTYIDVARETLKIIGGER